MAYPKQINSLIVTLAFWIIYSFVLLSTLSKYVNGQPVPWWVMLVLFFFSITLGVFGFVDACMKMEAFIHGFRQQQRDQRKKEEK